MTSKNILSTLQNVIAKQFFLILVFFSFSLRVYSQDVILQRDGSEIKAIVKEVLDDVIKYHKFENQTGPVYSIRKSEVFMITYKNGSKDVFKETASKEAPASESNSSKENESEKSSDDAEDPDKPRIEAAASNVFSQIISCCSARKENARFEIYYDAILKNSETGEIKIPIKVSWTGAFEQTRWVKGTAILFPNKLLGWTFQAGSSGCGKNCQVK